MEYHYQDAGGYNASVLGLYPQIDTKSGSIETKAYSALEIPNLTDLQNADRKIKWQISQLITRS